MDSFKVSIYAESNNVKILCFYFIVLLRGNSLIVVF